MTPQIKQKISQGVILYNQTEDGKLKKKESLNKRSQTMATQREAIRKDLTEKSCSKCQIVKDVAEFGKKSDTKDGYQSYCRACISIAKAKTRHKDAIK
jgi:nitrate/TMAO reductase-like tetraheme cytochrome c subunit